VDEIGFGPKRAARPPSRRLRRLRGFAAAALIGGAAAACVVLALTAANAHHAVTSPPPASQAAGFLVPVVRLPSPGCSPTQTVWPDLASLPAGLRVHARPIIIDEQFSGQCRRPSAPSTGSPSPAQESLVPQHPAP
jgi:hypothetical protein